MRGTNTHIQRSDVTDDVGISDTIFARLLDPLPAKDLADPELARLETRARREQQEREEQAWRRVHLRFQVAKYRLWMMTAMASSALHGFVDFVRPTADALWQGHAEVAEARNLMMTVPAGSKAQLKLKLSERRYAPKDQFRIWQAALEADAERLGVKLPQPKSKGQ